MKKRPSTCSTRFALLFFIFFFSPILLGFTNVKDAKPVYFSEDTLSIHQFIQWYTEVYDTTSLEGKIDYLLMRLERSHLTLERNGKTYSATQGVQFLRWKMDRPRWEGKVDTADDFVENIVNGSVTSVKPYLVIFPDGRRINAQEIFRSELKLLQATQATPDAHLNFASFLLKPLNLIYALPVRFFSYLAVYSTFYHFV